MKSLFYHAFGVKGFRYLRTRYEGRAGLPDGALVRYCQSSAKSLTGAGSSFAMRTCLKQYECTVSQPVRGQVV